MALREYLCLKLCWRGSSNGGVFEDVGGTVTEKSKTDTKEIVTSTRALRCHGLRKDIEAWGFVMLQLVEPGSYPRERLALEHPDRWSQQVEKFLHLIASTSAKELLSVSYLNPHFLYVLNVLACFLDQLTTKGGAGEPDWLCLDILAYPILSWRVMMVIRTRGILLAVPTWIYVENREDS